MALVPVIVCPVSLAVASSDIVVVPLLRPEQHHRCPVRRRQRPIAPIEPQDLQVGVGLVVRGHRPERRAPSVP